MRDGREIRYQVGRHVLEIAAKDGRWTATVDGTGIDQWFMSLADAWTAGVTEAGRRDEHTRNALLRAARGGAEP